MNEIVKSAQGVQVDLDTQLLCECCGKPSAAEPLPNEKDELTDAQKALRLRARVMFRQNWGVPSGALWCEPCCVEWEVQKRTARGYM